MSTVATLAVKIAANINDFSPKLSKAEKDFVKAAKKIQDTGKSMMLGITVPALAVGGAMVKMAADAEEAGSKFDAVFGRNARAMDQWVKEARRSIPATTSELRAMTSDIQNLLIPLGMAPDAAMKMTQSVATLAADLGSFNNISTDDALQRIRSGLVGQYEPLLKFGVALNAANVKQEALRLGLIQQGQELNANARAQAAYSLILKGTAAAHGDAARTVDSTTNQLKFLAAETKEAAIAFGGLLVPAVRPAVSTLRNVLTAVNEMPTPLKVATTGVVGIAAAAGPAIYLTGAFAEKLVVLRRALIAVNGASAMGGLLTMLGRFSPWIAGATVVVGGLAYVLHKNGEAARVAASQLEAYRNKLAGISDKKGFAAEQLSLQKEFDRLRVGRWALDSTLGPEDATDPFALAQQRLANAPIRAEIGAIDRQMQAITGRMTEVSTAYTAFVTGTGGGGGDGDGPADWLDQVADRVNVVTTALKQFRETGVTIPGLAEAMAEAFDAIASAGQRAGTGVTAGANRVRAMRQDLREALAIDLPGAGKVNVDRLLGVRAPRLHGDAAVGSLVGSKTAKADAEIRKIWETAQSNTANIVAELKNVPAQIASNLSAFLGPAFARMGVGGATGGLLGTTVGSAIGQGLAKKMGVVTGSLMGPLGGMVGGFIGAGIGSLVGRMFGKSKDRTDEAADAMRRLATTTERVNAALTNLPQGYKIAAARFRADVPDALTDDPDRDRDGKDDPVKGGGGGGGKGPTNPNPGKDDVARDRAAAGHVFDFTGSQIVLPGVTDPESFLDELMVAAERRAARGGISPLLAFS